MLDVLLDHAEHLRFEDFRTVVRRWEHLADEDGTLDDAEANHANRTAGLHEVNGCLDLRASGGRPLEAAEMLGIFERFVEDEFRIDVAARTELHGPDAPASLLPRTDAQRRFDALATIFRTAASMPAGARAPEPVVNLLCDIETFETLLARHRLIPFPDDLPLTDLARSRCETDSGIVVPPEHMLQAALLRARSAGDRRRQWCGVGHGTQATPVQGCGSGGGEVDGVSLRSPRLHGQCALCRGRSSR